MQKRNWREFFDRAYEKYGPSIKACGFHEKSFWARQKHILSWLYTAKGEAIRGKKVLDIGCGPGLFLTKLLADNYVIGMDISEKMLTRISPKIRPVQADMEKLPFKGEIFDYIFCIETLQCLQGSLDDYLEEIYRSLRPGGMFIASTLNKESVARRAHSCFVKFYNCLNLFSMDEMKKAMISAGFLRTKFLLDYYPLAINECTEKPSYFKKILATSYVVIAEKP